jgi:Hg(II)-responsive transcriptional regulator
MNTLTIGKVAEKAEVNVETIRYYERKGLLSKPIRRSSGYRHYPTETITRILFIKRAQKLGFSLNEISKLLNLRVTPNGSCDEARDYAEAKIREIEEKVRQLNSIKRTLEDLVGACQKRSPTDNCPILQALEVSKKRAI